VVRASAVEPTPPEMQKLVDIYGAIKPDPKTGVEQAEQVGELVIALYRARHLLNQHDEDTYPTLWKAYLRADPPLRWYSSHAEHMMLAALMVLLDASLRKEPIGDVLFYELDRAEAEPAWPPTLQQASHGTRGLAYFSAGYHYAADEELSAYLDRPHDLVDLRLEIGLHVIRAWNRMAMDRDDAATADLEWAMRELDKLGVDDELTDWGWATVKARQGQYAEASARLEKLAQSPYLDAGEKADIHEYAAQMQKKKGMKLFGKQRAQWILIRALIARGGGLEKVLKRELGDDLGGKIYAPLASYHRLTHSLSDHLDYIRLHK
jgi:hypothetical protein